MNRKQKKAKRLNATAHTKKQATVYLTPDEEQKMYEWKAHSIEDDELDEISKGCKEQETLLRLHCA